MGCRRAPLIALLACVLALTTPTDAASLGRRLATPVTSATTCSTCYAVKSGAVGTFAVLAATSVKSSSSSAAGASVGVYPGKTIVGYMTGQATVHAGDKVAAAAQAAALSTFNRLNMLSAVLPLKASLKGLTISGGVYLASTAVTLAGTVKLDAQNNPNASFIFLVPTTLTTAAASKVVLINGAKACNVVFVVGTSATLGASSTLVGNIIARSSIVSGTGVTVQGSLNSLTGAVSLATTTINLPCPPSAPSPPSSKPPSPPSPSPPPPPYPQQPSTVLCSGYTFTNGQDCSDEHISTFTNTSAAAHSCSLVNNESEEACNGFNTNYAGVSVLFASHQSYPETFSNPKSGMFTKTCDYINSGYVSMTAWDWAGPSAPLKVTCNTEECCKAQCESSTKCDVFVWDNWNSVCKWQKAPASMKAGVAVSSIYVTSYMKISSLM